MFLKKKKILEKRYNYNNKKNKYINLLLLIKNL